ncbi:MAG: hypothetical protein M0Z95_04605 [Actinomycetota bacterium]|jgi:hypothetical protein|nr:hypothetical protein [Actinomycetota bacterium]
MAGTRALVVIHPGDQRPGIGVVPATPAGSRWEAGPVWRSHSEARTLVRAIGYW